MYKHTMVLTYLNLKTSASFEEEHVYHTNEPLVTLSQDLLGNDILKFDFNNESWKYFKTVLQSATDSSNMDIKVERAIKRRLKGTSKGIQVCFRGPDNLIWHVIVKFIETLEVSNH